MRKPSNDIISGLDFAGLPTPPAILIELIDTCNSSEVTVARLAEIIHQDAGVSYKVINAANSPVYRQFNDINRLLVVLGLKTVKTIAVTGAVQKFFSQVAHPIERYLDEINIIKEEIERVDKIILRIRNIAEELEQNSPRVDVNKLFIPRVTQDAPSAEYMI